MTDSTIELQRQIAAQKYALDMAEQLLRRVHFATYHSTAQFLDDELKLSGIRQMRQWHKDRDAWLEARP